MDDIWKRIEAWLQKNAPTVGTGLNPPAAEAAIKEAEEYLGITFPDDGDTPTFATMGSQPIPRSSWKVGNGSPSNGSVMSGLAGKIYSIQVNLKASTTKVMAPASSPTGGTPSGFPSPTLAQATIIALI